jgi:hypothetical protein
MQQELNESKRKLFEQVEINAAVLGHIRNAIDQSGESPPLDFASFLASVQRKHRETCGALWKRFVETVSVLYKQWLAILLPPSSEELRKHLNGAIQEILSATINNDSQAADSATINRLLHSLSRAIALEIQRFVLFATIIKLHNGIPRLAAEDSISTDIQVQNTLLESTLQTILNQLRAEHIPFDHLANSLQSKCLCARWIQL